MNVLTYMLKKLPLSCNSLMHISFLCSTFSNHFIQVKSAFGRKNLFVWHNVRLELSARYSLFNYSWTMNLPVFQKCLLGRYLLYTDFNLIQFQNLLIPTPLYWDTVAALISLNLRGIHTDKFEIKFLYRMFLFWNYHNYCYLEMSNWFM